MRKDPTVPDCPPDKPVVKWYFKPVAVLIAIAVAGPLAIPLIWASPALKKWQKIALVVIVILLTLWMFKAMVDLYNILSKELRNIQEALK